ncbi:MAG: hypothetical protein ACREPI_08835 [Candidatus Dormibacterales bacterium]
MKPRSGRRPGRLWLFFWGRRRRGFPGLLMATLAVTILLGLSYGLPGGGGASRWVGLGALVVIAALAAGSLLLALAAVLRRPGRR